MYAGGRAYAKAPGYEMTQRRSVNWKGEVPHSGGDRVPVLVREGLALAAGTRRAERAARSAKDRRRTRPRLRALLRRPRARAGPQGRRGHRHAQLATRVADRSQVAGSPRRSSASRCTHADSSAKACDIGARPSNWRPTTAPPCARPPGRWRPVPTRAFATAPKPSRWQCVRCNSTLKRTPPSSTPWLPPTPKSSSSPMPFSPRGAPSPGPSRITACPSPAASGSGLRVTKRASLRKRCDSSP